MNLFRIDLLGNFFMAYCAHGGFTRDTSRSRRTRSQRTKSTDYLATRTDRVSRWRDRAVEAADRQTASHAVRALFGETRSGDRAAGVAARSAAAERCGEGRRSTGTTGERRGGGPTGTAAVASAPATGSTNLSTKARSLPGLRWRAEASRRRCSGDAGNRTDPLQSDPPGSS